MAWNLRSRPCLAEPPAAIALDDENFRLSWVAVLTVSQLAGQRGQIQRALAACEFAGFARSLAGKGGFNDLADNFFGFAGVFFKPVCQLFS